MRTPPLNRRFVLFLCAGLVSMVCSNQSWAKDETTGANQALPDGAKWCHRCHGETGTPSNSRIPNLAGQKAGYLAKQLSYFQQDSPLGGTMNVGTEDAMRVHRSMGFNAKKLEPKDIAAVAAFYASQTCHNLKGIVKIKTPVPDAVKRCTQCHGEKGINDDDEIPNLAGQGYEYLVYQLTSFHETKNDIITKKKRDWRQHPVMSEIARSLSPREINAVAAYFSGLSCE